MELSTANNSSKPQCVWVTTITNQDTRYAVAVLEFLGKYFLPVFITCATFISLMLTVKKPNSLFLRHRGNAGVRLLRMCTFTAFVLAFCWFPNQLYYLLFKFHVTHLNVPGHHVTVVLCMFNSCVNPWVYCVTNKTYRRKFFSLFRKCFPQLGESETSTAFEGSMPGGESKTLTMIRSSASCVLENVKHFDNKGVEESDDLEIIEVSKQKPLEDRNEPQMGRICSPSNDAKQEHSQQEKHYI